MLYVGYGSDTDCDGTQNYIVLIDSASEDAAWEFVKERGGMTMDGIHTIQLAADALMVKSVSAYHFASALKWLDRELDDCIEMPYGYCTTEARWNPWVEDDTIGIPALDTRYEED